MNKIFVVLSVVAAILMFKVARQESESVIIYSCLDQHRGSELQRQLDEKFPEENILVMYMSTAKTAARVKVEQENIDADIIVALEISYLEMVKSALADIDGFQTQEYLPDLTIEDNDNKYAVWERYAGSFIVNKDVLEKHDLPLPTSYEDLLDERFEGLIAMPDPKSSGTGYFFYLNLVNELGEEKALEYFDSLEKNIKSFTESGSGPIKLLIQEEVAVGLGMTFQAVEQINRGSPFEIIYPEQGSPYSLSGTALVKGREDDEQVKNVFEYIINDFMVYDKENFSPEQVLLKQKNNMADYPENIQYANMDGFKDIEEKERLLSLWKY